MKYLGGLAVALLLSACGGGSPPPPTTTAPLFTTAPAALTVGVGSLSTFDIRGGSSPYTAVSNNVGVAISLVNGSVLTLGGVAEGTAGVSIRDAAGVAVNVALTVSNGPSRPLFTEAPSTLTLAPGLAGVQTYRIGGGAGPYTATSSNASVVSVVVNGSNMTITGLKAGIGDVRILDSLGGTVTVSVTVAANSDLRLFTTAPSGLTVAVGSNPSYSVGGGTGPYTATSSNTSVATVSISDNILSVRGLSFGSANIVVRDSAGATVTVSMTVPTAIAQALFTTAPASVTLAIGASPTYNVGGGSGSGYAVTSSNTAVATASLVGTTLTVNGVTAGTANVVVRDSAGTTVAVAVTVTAASNVALFTTAPPSVTVAVGTSPAYNVGGGSGSGYTATSSNTTVATVGLTGTTLTVTGVTAGSANVVVRDSAGASVAVAVTVPAVGNVALFTTAPPSVTVAIGASPTYSVGGGSGSGYTATSSNAGIASVSLVGTSLTVTGVTVGSASVVVRDNAGATVTFTVSVGTLTLAVTPSVATGIINDVLIATLTGGTPPYRASVGNILVATAAVQNSNELRIQLLQVGQTIVTVLDANNQSVAYSLTSNAATPGIRLSPGAVTISEFDNQPIFFTVFGAAPGALNVFSSDVTKLTATINGQEITVNTGTSGNRCVNVIGGLFDVTITVVDSTRASGVATVTIRDNGGVCP